MKLVRFERDGQAAIGIVRGDMVVDLAEGLAAMDAADPELARAAARGSMRAFLEVGEPALAVARRAAETGAAASPLADAKLLAPVGDPEKIVCVGQNYRDHCEEQNQPIPDRAILFAKYPSAIIGPWATIMLPPLSKQVDYEAELAFVVGKRGRFIPEDRAHEHIAGYMCLNDISARDIQFADKQWVRGKTFDTFAPTGPWLVTADEVGASQRLDISLALNGCEMQRSNTRNLVFGVNFLVAYISAVVTLQPGDIVATGTPGGVGAFRNPPVFLQQGDEVSVTIERIGTLTNRVAAGDGPA
ncbi:MAG TPA: fumarylacetoacetate hydrolase family protein [Chthonomonadales bacterium]|nr:fumarylacetoacetate hydrolase family protein [Chthonomonadales bacterium]